MGDNRYCVATSTTRYQLLHRRCPTKPDTTTELANLRRTRPRCRFRLKQAEDLARSYRDKPVELEARICAIAPELELPVKFREPTPVFSRIELTQLGLATRREADDPRSP